MRARIHRPVLGVSLLAAAGWFGSFLMPSTPPTESFCPGGSDPSSNVVLCEDFESGASQRKWDIGSNRDHWPPSEFVLCAQDRFGFNDRCAAWSNRLVFDRAWGFYGYDARRAFAPQSELYVRWYQYISDPYTWGTLEDKAVLLHDSAETIAAYIATNRNQSPHTPNSGPGMPFVANYQDLDWPETGGKKTLVNRFQNQGRNITLQPGKWYLFEWYIKLNTPGAPDGVLKLWIDDASQPISTQTLRMHHTDMRWLRGSDAGKKFGVLRLTVYHQGCDRVPNTCPPNGPVTLDQSHRWDLIVISRTPVGPLAEAHRRRSSTRIEPENSSGPGG